jgi:hypothetical protein
VLKPHNENLTIMNIQEHMLCIHVDDAKHNVYSDNNT